jgi:hypothetical protein
MSAELRSRSKKKKKAKDERGRPESIDLSGTDHALPKNVHLQAQGDGQYKVGRVENPERASRDES